jgi:hypothetical protein
MITNECKYVTETTNNNDDQAKWWCLTEVRRCEIRLVCWVVYSACRAGLCSGAGHATNGRTYTEISHTLGDCLLFFAMILAFLQAYTATWYLHVYLRMVVQSNHGDGMILERVYAIQNNPLQRGLPCPQDALLTKPNWMNMVIWYSSLHMTIMIVARFGGFV